MAGNVIDDLSIQVTASADSAIKSIDRLVGKLGRLQSAVSGTKNGTGSAAKGLESVGAAAGQAASPIQVVADELVTMAGHAETLSEKLRDITSGLGGMASKLATQSKELNGLGANAQSASNRIAQLGNEISNAGMKTRVFSDSMDVAKERVIQSADNADYAAQHTRSFGNTLAHIAGSPIKMFSRGIAGAISGIQGFISGLVRIAKYRFIRAMIKDLVQSFKDLYGYSDMFGTGFADAMDSITTSTTYLRNSLAAMVDPLIEMFAPALDYIIDKVVDLMNWFNQLFAAIGGQDTYTVARRVAREWGDTFNDANNNAHRTVTELKRTILGFDEINKLNDNTSRGGGGRNGSSPYTPGYETMFETKPLEGFFKQISDFSNSMPDWLKWLFGGAALVGGFLLISKLIDKIKNLFGGDVPGWVDKLFDVLDLFDGNDHPLKIDIPDKLPEVKVSLDLPDNGVDLKANVQKGLIWDEEAWRAANMSGTVQRSLDVSVVKNQAQWSAEAWKAANVDDDDIKKKLKVAVEMDGVIDHTFVDNLLSQTQAAIDDTELADILSQGVSKAQIMDNWDDTAWAAALMGGTKNFTLQVGVKKAADWDNVALMIAQTPSGSAVHYLTVGVQKSGNAWDNVALSVANMPSGSAVHYLTVGLKKSVYWDNVLLTVAQMPSGTAVHYLVVGVKKSEEWNYTAWKAAQMLGATVVRQLKIGVQQTEKKWNSDAWKAAQMLGATVLRTLKVGVQQTEKKWDANAWKAAQMLGATVLRQLKIGVQQTEKKWNSDAWKAAQMLGTTVVRQMKVGVQKTEKKWNTEAWRAAQLLGTTIVRQLKIGVQQTEKKWNSDAWKAAQLLGATVVRQLKIGVQRTEKKWDESAWKAAQMVNHTTTITVDVKVQKSGWTTIEKFLDDNFGGAAGGGGGTVGGGAGRDDVNHTFRIPVAIEQPTTNFFQWWWKTTKASWEKEGEILVMTVDAVKGWTDTLANYLGFGDEEATVSVDSQSQWQIFGKSFISWIGAYNPKTKVGVDASTPWNNDQNELLKTIGAKDLKSNVKFSASVAQNGSTVYVQPRVGGVGEWVLMTKKLGGMFFNSMWSDIPQYEGGTFNAHGSLFLAGEAGPEIVGHVGGRTEVLNKSQLAATMYSAVQAAMAPASANFAAAATQMYQGANDGEDMETLMEMVRQTNDATMRQNELLRQQNDYLRQLNERDLTVDITTSGISRAQARANRRAGTTVIPVGT